MYEHAAAWAKILGQDPSDFSQRAARLKHFIQTGLWDESNGFFYDHWTVKEQDRVESYVGIWPVIVGAATEAQAKSVVEKHILNPARFFTAHPISTIGVKDPKFQLLTFHGPAWNSMTYLTALGCQRYGYPDAARQLVERALDDTAAQFQRTGKIWEFYHPFGGKPEDMKREVKPPYLMPYRDYMGHNPLLAMAGLYDRLKQ